MTGMGRRKRIHEPSPLELAAFNAYHDGDVTCLGALADYLGELGQRKAFAKLLRRVVKAMDGATHFFFTNAAYGWDLKKETPGEGRLRGATKLARAERWFESHDEDVMRCRWVIDNDVTPSEDGSYGLAWGAILEEHTGGRIDYHTDDEGWTTLQSLWGITFAGDGYPDGDPYARVVRAELCLEAMP